VGSRVPPVSQRSAVDLLTRLLLAAYVCGTAIIMIHVMGPPGVVRRHMACLLKVLMHLSDASDRKAARRHLAWSASPRVVINTIPSRPDRTSTSHDALDNLDVNGNSHSAHNHHRL
jgi:hypothetical protein